MLSSRESFENSFNFFEILSVGFDCPKSRFIVIAKGSLAVIDASPNFFSDSSTNIYREVPNVLIRHAEFDRDHQNVVRGQVSFFKRTNLLNGSALEHSDYLTAVIEVPRQSIEFPC